MRRGWYKESYRHHLAAKGVTTSKYLASNKFKFAPLKEPEKIEDKQKKQEPIDKLVQETNLSGSKVSPQTALKRFVATEQLQSRVSEAVKKERPINKLLDQVRVGNYSEALEQLNSNELNSNEREAIRSALAVYAISNAKNGLEVSEEVLNNISSSSKKRVKILQEESNRELESPFKTEARELAKDAVVAAVDAPLLAVEQIGSATKEGVKTISPEGKLTGEPDNFPGILETIDGAEQSPVFTNNIALGKQKIEPLFGDGDTNVAMGGSNPVMKSDEPTYSDKIQEKIDSLYNNRKEFAKVKESSFKKGNDEFKKGNREGIIRAIEELQGEESKLKDRWNLVNQVHVQMQSNENQESSFKSDGGMFGNTGAKRLADQTKKLNDARKELVESNNRVASRRQMLQLRLKRLDSQVPPESWVPQTTKRFEDKNDFFNLME